jgi:hypothetical protein
MGNLKDLSTMLALHHIDRRFEVEIVIALYLDEMLGHGLP